MRTRRNAWGVLSVLVAVLSVLFSAQPAMAEQAGSSAARTPAGGLDAGGAFSCAILSTRQLRCWGFGNAGRLGYGNTASIGDNETPDSAGPVNMGKERVATSIAAGNGFTCAIMDTTNVRCWGYAAEGQLGGGNTNAIGDNEHPGVALHVNIGAGRTARAITAGNGQTCVILDNAQVRCWGYAINGQVGYGNTNNIGDDETPGGVGPVNLGSGRTATAVSAGDFHTCAILDTGEVRCWGNGADGRLGYGNANSIGDDETPAAVGPVDLGSGRAAIAISAGGAHTCAILDTGQVRCWGNGGDGQLGYGNTTSVGDDEMPGSVGPVDLGSGRTALAIASGRVHTCVLLDDGAVRCWGNGGAGQLGYGNTGNVGDNETPGSVGPVSIGSGRSAAAIAAGGAHTCAALDSGEVRCWGDGSSGQLGFGNTSNIGDDETPDSVGPVKLGGSFLSTFGVIKPPPGTCPGAPSCAPVAPACAGESCPPPPCRGAACPSAKKRAVAPFQVRFTTRSLGPSGLLVGLADLRGVLAGSRVNIRCLSRCRLDAAATTKKGRRAVKLPRRVVITTRSRLRVTISRKGRIARYRTYRFQRPKVRYIAELVNAGCANDVRGTKIFKCSPARGG